MLYLKFCILCSKELVCDDSESVDIPFVKLWVLTWLSVDVQLHVYNHASKHINIQMNNLKSMNDTGLQQWMTCGYNMPCDWISQN
jgi:hypothetical protein